METADDGPLDLTAALAWAGGDRALLEELIGMFVRDWPERRLALSRAFDAGQDREAHRLVHSLKGSTAILGAEGARAHAAELERRLADGRMDADSAALLGSLQSAVDEAVAHLERLQAEWGPGETDEA